MAMDLNKLRAKKGMPIPATEAKQERPKEPPKVETEAERAARVQRKLEKARLKRESRTPEGRDVKMERKGRLPDRSRFDVQWDAAKEKWAGSLVIETETGPRVFSGWHRGVFGLLAKLDVQYREWLARNTSEVVSG